MRRIDRFSVILAAASAMAQAPAGPTVIRTETRMVLVDAVVTGKSGGAVRDLTAKDFHVWEDGKEQTIQSVSFVADPSLAAQRSYLVLFFDNVSMDAASQSRARDAALQFIEANAGPNRYMAIVNYSGSIAISQNFTTDTDRLKREASREYVVGDANLATGGGSRARVQSVTTAGSGANGFMRGLRVLAANLAGVPGRKNVVLFSAGYAGGNVELHNAVETCNRSDVALYPVDAGGLTQPGAPQASAPIPRGRGGNNAAQTASVDAAGVGAQHAVGEAELLGDDRAVRGAHVVEEGERDRLAAQAGQRDRLAVLVDQRERRSGKFDGVRGAIDSFGDDRVGVGARSRRGPSGRRRRA